MNRPGDRVRVTRLDDPYAGVPLGTKGTVTFIDSMNTVHVDFDTGHKLGLIQEAGDRWTTLTPQRGEEVAA